MDTEAARECEIAVLRAFADVGQTVVAQATSITDTKLSRFKGNSPDGGGLRLSEVAAVFATLGLRVISARDDETVTVPKREHLALLTFAHAYTDQLSRCAGVRDQPTAYGEQLP